MIKALSEDLRNKVSAGEVVESPASVVKELIENSLDANCSVVNVSIENGGINTISVIDDGEGIHPNDLELIFLRKGSRHIHRGCYHPTRNWYEKVTYFLRNL